MTEKQYTYLNASKCKSIGSFFCNGIILTNEEVVDLLNENEQLKQQVAFLEEFLKTGVQYEYYQKVFDENEQLKSENEDMRRLINNISHQRDEFHRGARENANRVGKLKKENEGLKEDNAILKHALSRIICEFDEHIAKNSVVRDLIK